MNMKRFIHGIPKAELHIHMEGALEPELMFALAKKNNVSLPYASIAQVRRAYHFRNLQSFLDIYYQGLGVLIHEADFYQTTWSYLERAARENVRHAEIFFDPQAHTRRGVPFDTVVLGIHRALEEAGTRLGLSAKLILCFLRDLDLEDAQETFSRALPFKGWIAAVGLDSSEWGHPPEKFKPVFDRARRHGFKAVAHAGEEGPPEYIWQALNLLNAERIDHGVRCMEDPRLVDDLVIRGVPLTVCPLSNVKLRVFGTLRQHNLKQMLDRGLRVTINSDDPAYFGGYIEENFRAIQKAHGLGTKEIHQLARNAFHASFLSPEEKKAYLDEVDAFVKDKGGR